MPFELFKVEAEDWANNSDPMLEEKSAGIVIFRKEHGRRLFLLLHYPSGHWDFVKGKIEKDENPKEAAIRETTEETGIKQLDFVENFEDNIEYNYQYEGKLVHKKVIFFLATTSETKITLSHEHVDYAWLPFEEAYKKTTYENAKSILSKANKILSDS